MSGLPFQQAIQPKILATVWNQTDFGTVWKWRLIFWLASAAAATSNFIKLSPLMQKAWVWIQFSLGGLLLGSLARAGHGVEGPLPHLLADILHLLMAGLWPAGLLPFALVLRQLRRGSEPERWHAVATLVHRFSALSLASVSLLAATGLVNSWILVGSFANLTGQTYGRWLLAKVILFGVAVSIGAVNLLRLKLRLLAEGMTQQKTSATASQLQRANGAGSGRSHHQRGGCSVGIPANH